MKTVNVLQGEGNNLENFSFMIAADIMNFLKR